MENNSFAYLVSPATGLSLKEAGGYLAAEEGAERFQIKNGVACLLEPGRLDKFKKDEMDIFDNLDIQGAPYFRNTFFKRITDKITSMARGGLLKGGGNIAIAEMGGGEGYWAKAMKAENPSAEVFVCDLSMKTLERAPDGLRKIYADITRPVFQKGSISLAAFWVSLHHLSPADRISALKNIVGSLKDGGILLIFEPNGAFFPRKIMYNTRLRKDVYRDEHEEAIDFSEISKTLKGLGLTEEAVYFMNPPYNPDFIKKLRNWFMYMAAVELLYQFERWVLDLLLGDLLSARQSRLKKYLSLYGFAVFRKNNGN